MEYLARTQPVENPARTNPAALDTRIDQRITHILGRTVVPMFNALIATSGEHRRELIELRADIENVERKLCRHHTRLATLEGDAPADGRTVAVQCKNRSGRWTVPSADMQKFAGAARAIDPVDVALFVATSNFSHELAPLKGVSQRSSSGGVRSPSTFSVRTSSPQTTYRYLLVYTGVQVVRVM